MGQPEIIDPEVASALERKAAAEAKLAAKKAAAAGDVAKRDALDAAALAEALAEHGEVGDAIATVRTGAGLVIVKRPTHSRWRRFEKEGDTKNEDRREDVGKAMVLDHLVHPTREGYLAISERYPALSGDLLLMIAGLARGGSKALSGE